MYYLYRQNNTHGFLESPALRVVVKADSPTEADRIAMENGVYFDYGFREDCECCGMRWQPASDYNATDTLPKPSEWDTMFATGEDLPTQILV